MDTSEQYIKMCDCPEIQKKWDSLDCYGDWVAFLDAKHKDGTIPVHGIWHSPAWGLQTFNDCRPNPRQCTWLPRQDQIQEMIPECKCYVCLVERLHKFLEDNLNGMFETGIEGGMEQLWLAFYMWEKHKKTWDGKKWVA